MAYGVHRQKPTYPKKGENRYVVSNSGIASVIVNAKTEEEAIEKARPKMPVYVEKVHRRYIFD